MSFLRGLKLENPEARKEEEKTSPLGYERLRRSPRSKLISCSCFSHRRHEWPSWFVQRCCQRFSLPQRSTPTLRFRVDHIRVRLFALYPERDPFCAHCHFQNHKANGGMMITSSPIDLLLLREGEYGTKPPLLTADES